MNRKGTVQMQSEQQEKLTAYLKALKALQKSLTNALEANTVSGTGELTMRSYRQLHSKIAELLPDDFYVTETLAFTPPDGADERGIVNAAHFTMSQLVVYLEQMLIPDEPRAPRDTVTDAYSRHRSDDWEQWGKRLKAKSAR